MYHDQVLTLLKLSLSMTHKYYSRFTFLRITPDHGPNEMIGKNKSNPVSLIKAIIFKIEDIKAKKTVKIFDRSKYN